MLSLDSRLLHVWRVAVKGTSFPFFRHLNIKFWTQKSTVRNKNVKQVRKIKERTERRKKEV
jgi:hypothetical protein